MYADISCCLEAFCSVIGYHSGYAVVGSYVWRNSLLSSVLFEICPII